jgi:diacylglycerol kinase family enzyme
MVRVCPAADAADGLIDVVVVDCIGGVFKLIGAFVQLMKGKILEYPRTTHFRCERVRFSTDTPCTAQLDGELYPALTFDVKLCKGLNFYRK